LAQVGKERLDEIENPELAQERMKEIYEQKGYPKDWINKRLRGIAIRQSLTDEWQELPNSFSVSFLALPATLPPLFATFLFLSKVSGFSFFDISVVTRSPNIVKIADFIGQK
jgi:hypothetical protein